MGWGYDTVRGMIKDCIGDNGWLVDELRTRGFSYGISRGKKGSGLDPGLVFCDYGDHAKKSATRI